MNKKFSNFSEFYPYYLSQHSNTICRKLHFIGVFSSLTAIIILVLTFKWMYIPLTPLIGYAFGWTGHFLFEKNKPATLDYPIYSFLGDIRMTRDLAVGKIQM